MLAFFLINIFSYIQYSSISARLTRRALKPQFKADAMKREDVNAKVTQWKDGKPVSQSKTDV